MVTTFTHVVLPPGRKLMQQGEMADDIFVDCICRVRLPVYEMEPGWPR